MVTQSTILSTRAVSNPPLYFEVNFVLYFQFNFLMNTIASLMVGQDLEGGKYFINAVREGETVLFACDDENECSLWVMALYRATGQSHKPTPPVSQNSAFAKVAGDDKAKKHGMEDFVTADPCKYDHASLFKLLQNLSLEYRLNDPYASLVSKLPIHHLNRFSWFINNSILFISCSGLVQSWTNICVG